MEYLPGVGISEYEEEKMLEALERAKECDIIVLALGEEPMMSGESNSRMDICLPGRQEDYAKRLFALGKPVVVVLYSGRPLAVPEIAGKANALLEAWMPGTEGNRAVRDILTGHRSPSERLTMSFPYSTGQCPVYYNRYSTGRPAKDPYHSDRFTSRYIDGPSVPFYPFGHGLTYTEFEYGSVELSSGMMRRGGIYARCTVRNTGERESYI